MFTRQMIRLETLYPSPSHQRRAKALILTLLSFTVLTFAILLAIIANWSSVMRNFPDPGSITLIATGITLPIILIISYQFLINQQLNAASRISTYGLLLLTSVCIFMLPLPVNTAAVTGLILIPLVFSFFHLPQRDHRIVIGVYLFAIVAEAVFVFISDGTPNVFNGGDFLPTFILLAAVGLVGGGITRIVETYNANTEKAEAEAVALSNLVNILEQQTDRLTIINEISQMSGDEIPFDSLGGMIAEKIMPILAPEHVSIAFLEGNRQYADITTFAGPQMLERLSLNKTPFQLAMNENRTVRLSYRDHQQGTRFLYQVKGVKFMLIIPLSVREQMYGTLNIGFTEPDSIIADDVRLCEQIANQLAVMIENMHLYGKLDTSLDEQSALFNTTIAINSANDLPTIYQMAMKELAKISDANRVDIFIAGPDPHNIISTIGSAASWQDGRLSVSPSSEPLNLLDHPYLASLSGLKTNLVLIGEEIEEKLPIEIRRIFLDSGVRELMIMPLSTGPVFLGLVIIQGFSEHGYSNMQIRLCKGIVDQVAMAIDSQTLLERARDSARREQILNKLSYQMQRATSIDQVVQIALREVKQTFGAKSVTLSLGTPSEENEEADRGENYA